MRTQVCFDTSKTQINTEMRFANIRDKKLLIEKETGLKIDFKRSKNTLRGAWGLVSGEIDIKKMASSPKSQRQNKNTEALLKKIKICYNCKEWFINGGNICLRK